MSQSLLSFSPLLLSLLIITTAVQADFGPFYNDEDYLNRSYGLYPRQRYISAPEITGPVANILKTSDSGLSPSKYVMWAAGGFNLPAVHPMILEANTGTTVWQGPIISHETMGPTVQRCNGSDYLTMWSGNGLFEGRKAGKSYIYNKNYELVWTISAKGGLKFVDGHEIFLTPQCTAIVTVYETHPHDLSHWNMTDGYLMNSYFQEIDLATDELIFQWSAVDNMDITDSIWRPENKQQGFRKQMGYDFAHLNSIEKDYLGNYLLSMRHTSNVLYVSGVDGHVIWTLGGKRNDFEDLSGGNATNFAWQHHARWVDNQNLTKISIFDDRSSLYQTTENNLTRGIIVEIDTTARTVRLDKSYDALHDIQAMREGSMQVLQDSPEPGNVILGYGNEAAWTEYAPNGTVLFDVTFAPFGLNRLTPDNYRALKVNWTGEPTWNPSIASGPNADYSFNKSTNIFEILRHDHNGEPRQNTTAYFSWNGATDISYWIVLTSKTNTNMTISSNFEARVVKKGFEIHYSLPYDTRFVRAIAVSDNDVIMGATAILELASGATTEDVFDYASAQAELTTRLSSSKKLINTIKDHFEGVKNTVQGHVSQVAAQHPATVSAAWILAAVAVLGMVTTCVCCRSRRSRLYRSPLMTFVRSSYRDVENAFEGNDSELDSLSPSLEEKFGQAPKIKVFDVDGSESSEGEDDEDFKVARGYFDTSDGQRSRSI
ncbi:hypothetical protein MBLNU457_7013t1 [Dothideomycetes sp. NU457]